MKDTKQEKKTGLFGKKKDASEKNVNDTKTALPTKDEKDAAAEKRNAEKNKRMTMEDIAKAEKEAELQRLKMTLLGKHTPFVINEVYKATRTNIMFSLKDVKGPKSIIVTSSNPGEGKSTNCINIAISFAQTGQKVILIDADMRKPRIHKYFELPNKEGLSNVLGGFVKLDSVIRHDDETGIDIITSGHIPPNPAELIGSEEMDNLISELYRTYDYVFFDTPPINVVTDAAMLSKKVTGIIAVVRHNVTSKDTLERCMKTLEFAGARVIGFILNAVEQSVYAGRYAYGGYRKRSYKRYGYGKYGYGKYGYGKYGYGKYGYGKYGYGSKYGYGYGSKYGYGYGSKYGYGYGGKYGYGYGGRYGYGDGDGYGYGGKYGYGYDYGYGYGQNEEETNEQTLAPNNEEK